MSKTKAIYVVFDWDVADRHIENIVQTIRHIRGVVSVDLVESKPLDDIDAERRVAFKFAEDILALHRKLLGLKPW